MPAANSGTGRKRSPEQSPDDLQTASPSRRLKAPVFDGTGKKSKDLTLDELVFGAEVKPHLVHEAVRAELSADRAGTRAVIRCVTEPAPAAMMSGKFPGPARRDTQPNPWRRP